MMLQGQLILRLREYGESVLESIKANDPRLSAAVHVSFRDGTESIIARAFPEVAGDWLFIFSTRDGYFLFHKSDVLKWTSQDTPTSTMLKHDPVAQGQTRRAA